MAEPVKTRYDRLSEERQPFLDRARLCSKVTIPSLIPDDGFNATSTIDTPFQSIGANGVNSLSAQLLLTLMPPNSPFFRLTLDEFRFGTLDQDAPKVKQEAEESLSKLERRVMLELETSRVRITLHEALRHVLVGGNVLVYIPPEGSSKYYPLSKYVVDQDPTGFITDIVVKEQIDPATLSPEVRAMVSPKEMSAPTTAPDDMLVTVRNNDGSGSAVGGRKLFDLYTVVTWVPGTKKYQFHQEINGVVLPKTEASYVKEELPFLHLPYQPVEGSPYARSMCEEYLGDLLTAEGLSQAIVEGSLSAARTINLVRPNAVVRTSDLNNAANGAYLYGNEGDVTTIKSDKAMDLRIARETLNDVFARLSTAFLMHTSIQRQAERVTAEEIRFMAQQLEQNLGGIYSVLSQALQLPLVSIMLGRLRRRGLIGKVDNKTVQPVVIAGIEALGRGNDLNRLDILVGQSLQMLGERVSQYLNVGEYMRRRATALGIDAKGLVYTEEELAAQAQQAQQQQLMSDVAPVAVKAAMSPQSQG